MSQNSSDTNQRDGNGSASLKTMSFKVCCVLGLPGAGKGTLCAMVKDQINFAHLSVGDHLRELCKSDANTTPLDRFGMTQNELKVLLDKRQSVPPHQITPIIRDALTTIRDAGQYAGVLLDGYPREMAQIADEEHDADFYPVCVMKLVCDPQTAKSRFLARRRAADDTGQVWDYRAEKFSRNQPDVDDTYKMILHEVSTEIDVGQEEAVKAMLKVLVGVM
ncbi:hypothetical protein AMS68_001975 [Peltaster fructicola]|uniref:Adenylate kinase active site lid domain-containing protein n=1 Tax=Peltaster fructicola TaxID=286661 RepID=A0A6H0XPA3_9PEZI|nr:hypothetical protein AMS68_001975 [Peltaster fructicola]